jgi:hypothetical protein
MASLLATPSNIRRLVGGTTLLHTAAAGGKHGLVSALLAAGAAAGQQDSRGESVLAMVARQGSTAMLSLLLRRMLWLHKVSASADGAKLPQEVVLALQQALAHSDERSVFVFTAVMEVLGEGAASALWQGLVEQHRSSLAEQAGPGQQQQQQPPGQGQQQQQQRQLGRAAVGALLQGWLGACGALAEQNKSIMQPLEEAMQDNSQQQAVVAVAGRAGKQPPSPPPTAEAAAGAGPGVNAAAAGAVVMYQVATLATISAAASLGQQQEVQRLLQQLPRGTQGNALAHAGKAAGGSGHYQLCVQLVQQLAATDQMKALQVMRGVVAQSEGRPYAAVQVLGTGSLELCGLLLGGWQAVRRQQQREMVDGVVSAAVAWKQGQQEVQVHNPPRSKRHHRATGLQATAGARAGGAVPRVQQGPQEHPRPAGAGRAGAAAQDPAARTPSLHPAPVSDRDRGRARSAAAERTQQLHRRLGLHKAKGRG